MIEFEHVSTAKGGFLLQDISFRLEDGYIMALAGENGAGKTTLLKHILEPGISYSGKICIDGMDIRENRNACLERIAYVSDDHRMPEVYTVQEVCNLYSSFYERWSSQRLEAAFARLDVPRNQQIQGLSRGEYFRMQIALGIAHQADVFLMDEVTGGMDPIFRRELWRILRELAAEGADIVLVTHIMDEIWQKCDYHGIMKEGQLAEWGETDFLWEEQTGSMTENGLFLHGKQEDMLAAEPDREPSLSGRPSRKKQKCDKGCAERVADFDKKIIAYEEKRTFGIRGISLGAVIIHIPTVLLMLFPMGEISRDSAGIWLAQGGVLFFCVYLRMQWLFGLTAEGKQASWKEYLKYVPVDWRAYRHHRIDILISYTGKMLLCYAGLQVCVQLFAMLLAGAGFHLEGIVFAVVMCVLWILVPGLLMVWRWS